MAAMMTTTPASKRVSSGLLYFSGVSPLSLFLLWTVVGLLFALSSYVPAKAEGRQLSFASAATWYLIDGYLWFALCPIILSFYRRFPLDVPRIHRYGVHLLVAVVISYLQFSALIGLDKVLDPAFASRFPLFETR